MPWPAPFIHIGHEGPASAVAVGDLAPKPVRHDDELDWVGLWYAVAADAGANHICTLTRLDTTAAQATYYDFSHTHMDGAGCLGTVLRERGLALPELPTGRNRPPPSLGRLLARRLPLLWELIRAKRVPWRGGDAARVPARHEFAVLVCDAATTARIEAVRGAAGLSQNALLLAAAHRVLAPRLLSHDAPADWLFAVNLRGAVDAPVDTANQSTGIPIRCTFETTPRALHDQIRSKLERELHFLMWHASHIGRLIGVRGVRALSRRFARESYWMGTFSNMGAWPPLGSDPAPDPHEAWACIPPGTKNHPIGIGVLTWHGRLAVCLKIHPSVSGRRRRQLGAALGPAHRLARRGAGAARDAYFSREADRAAGRASAWSSGRVSMRTRFDGFASPATARQSPRS